MHQELSHEIHAEMLNIKKEVIAWQSEALRGQEVGSPFRTYSRTGLIFVS